MSENNKETDAFNGVAAHAAQAGKQLIQLVEEAKNLVDGWGSIPEQTDDRYMLWRLLLALDDVIPRLSSLVQENTELKDRTWLPEGTTGRRQASWGNLSSTGRTLYTSVYPTPGKHYERVIYETPWVEVEV